MSEQPSFDWFDEPPSRIFDPVFFALLLDRIAQQRVDLIAQTLAREHGLRGRRTALDRLHVSLCGVRYPREAAAELLPIARTAPHRARLPAFEANFDRALSFKSRSGNYPLVLVSQTEQILTLFRSLSGALARATNARERKAPLTPHVTMLYDPSMILEQPIEPVRWTVRELVLLHSLQGLARHVVLGRWPLDDT